MTFGILFNHLIRCKYIISKLYLIKTEITVAIIDSNHTLINKYFVLVTSCGIVCILIVLNTIEE